MRSTSRMNASCLMALISIASTRVSTIAEDTLAESHGHVIFSVMVWNHADQYPENVILPAEVYVDEDDFGLLTQAGKTRAYDLGRWTRRRYDTLINGEPYNTSLLQMNSSSYDRTVSSGQLFFAGFYPPTDEEKEIWNEDIHWQPISILSLPRFHDRMILPTESCARVDRQVDHIINWSEIRNLHDDYKMLMRRIQYHTTVTEPGDDIAKIIDTLHKVYDWLRIQKQIGLPLPEWAENIYPELSRHMRNFKEKVITPEILRLKGGPLFSNIMEKMKEKRNDPKFSRLFQFYVGHDTTIGLLLKMLGVFDDQLIHFCATLLFELRMKIDEDLEPEYVITVLYKNSDDIEADPKLLDLPYCPNPCLFDDFIERTKDRIISRTEWVKECNNSGINYNSMDILF